MSRHKSRRLVELTTPIVAPIKQEVVVKRGVGSSGATTNVTMMRRSVARRTDATSCRGRPQASAAAAAAAAAAAMATERCSLLLLGANDPRRPLSSTSSRLHWPSTLLSPAMFSSAVLPPRHLLLPTRTIASIPCWSKNRGLLLLLGDDHEQTGSSSAASQSVTGANKVRSFSSSSTPSRRRTKKNRSRSFVVYETPNSIDPAARASRVGGGHPPKQYFPMNRSTQQWRIATEALLNDDDDEGRADPPSPPTPSRRQPKRKLHPKNDDDPQQVSSADAIMEATRFWTTQRTSEGVRYTWKLWSRLEDVVVRRDDEEGGSSDTDPTHHVTRGRYPPMMHLLSAVVDAWRIVWEGSSPSHKQPPSGHPSSRHPKRQPPPPSTDNKSLVEDDGTVVESPQQVFQRLQSIDPRFVNARIFTILITAILTTLPAHPPPPQRHGRQGRHREGRRSEPSSSTASTDPLSAAREAAPLLCERIFRYMLELSTTAPTHGKNPAANVFPDDVAFTSVLNAWAKSGRVDAPMKALGFWSEWEAWRDRQKTDNDNNNDDERSAPSVFAYNTLIQAMASTHDNIWIGRAADVVHGMLGSHPHQQPLVDDRNGTNVASVGPAANGGADIIPRPNLATFRLIIGAYAAIRDVEQCLYWLNVMMEHGMGHVDVFAKVILCAAVSKQYEAAEETFKLLVQAIESPLLPDVTDASPHVAITMMRVYANTNRPHQAQGVLDRMEAAFPQLFNRTSYRIVLDGWINAVATSRRRHGRSADRAEPTHEYGIRFAAERAEQLLVRMIEASRRDGEVVWADRRTVDSVLNLWARSGDDTTRESNPSSNDDGESSLISPDSRPPEERAEALLRQLRDMGPSDRVHVSSSSYHHVMVAWSRSRDPFAVDRVMALLSEVEDDPHLVPNRRHYTVAMKCCADRYRSESRQNLETKLKSIFDRAVVQVESGNVEAAPDSSMMGTLLHAYARMGCGEAAERVLNVMLESSARTMTDGVAAKTDPPTIKEVNLVLLAWLRSGDSRAALSRSLELVRTMEKKHGLLPDDRSKHILRDLRERADDDDASSIPVSGSSARRFRNNAVR